MTDLKKIVVLYHGGCRDGFGAAWAAHLHFGDDADYIPIGFYEPLPEIKDSHVLFVDICPKVDVLQSFLDAGNRLTILDHHLPTRERVLVFQDDERVKAIYDPERSGAVITWDYFFPDSKLPKLLAHIQDRDLWRWEYPDTGPITEALRAVEFDFVLWDRLNKYPDALRDFRDSGYMLVALKKRTVEHVIKRAYMATVDGHEVPVVNSDSYLSEVGSALCKEYPDALFSGVWFTGKDGARKWSLRSVGEFDVSKVALKYGGGGHKNAAGFAVP